ncbi:GNAT family N-acetyltransferase [Paenibacillus herberti]|uniref:RimJ/RimL family protein N-acetyltransferase n=1 Tax=Paenibacillus herberti TaxID=1619309 RepID=A0A229P3B7_9BACL|nr:GNAT family protein [Paenibacillus herberti]OXM16786.1 RimJ/RimL family protein N-acetyltransferase [Paenibacillus herberti]
MFACELEKGLHLGLLRTADAKALYRTVERNRAVLEAWLPWVHQIENAADMKNYVRFECKRYKGGKAMSAVIFDGREAAGLISYQELDFRNRKATLGYWLDSARQGKGIMTDAAAQMIRFAFATLDLNRVEIRARADNRRSCAVAERLGFKQEGVLRQEEYSGGVYRDHIVYGLLEADWKRQETGGDDPNRITV